MNLLTPTIMARKRYRELLLFLFVLPLAAVADEGQHDFMLLPSVDTRDTFDESDPELRDSFVRPSLNTLYSFTGGQFRFLAEYLWSSTESEMERLQLGWGAGKDTMWWFGRFHTTSKFWTTEFHHGQFMQTSITRPSIEEWEDESGPIPSHITGVSMEHTRPGSGQQAWNLGLSFGLGPKFVEDELEPFDILGPESGHGLSFNARIAYQPDLFSNNQIGVTLGLNDINVESESDPALTDLDDIQQLTVGVFGDWRWDNWRLLGSLVHFEHDLRYTDDLVKDEFLAGYLQAEYGVTDRWTVFGRIDYSSGEDDSIYLRLLPAYVAHRHMLGVRWDFMSKQALTMEIADVSAQGEDFTHNTSKEVRFQWSAVFP